MRFRTLTKTTAIKGKRVLLRVDWNVALHHRMMAEDAVKIERSLGTIRDLCSRGAIVVVLTHLGRPKKRDHALSTKRLVPILKRLFDLDVVFHTESVTNATVYKSLQKTLQEAEPGSIHLLENVRFEPGEEKNDPRLAKAYAGLGDLFVNDAFASCHRPHATVIGMAEKMTAYAGPELLREIEALSLFLKKPARPFVLILGGRKLTSKLPVLYALLPQCDRVLVGGAMATTLIAATGRPIGRSFVETDLLDEARVIAADPRICLPVDAMVTKRLTSRPVLARKDMDQIGSDEQVVDVGTKTLRQWGEEIRQAKTVLWNGPLGIAEIQACGAGSRFLARFMKRWFVTGKQSVVGGGDTIPLIYATKSEQGFSHVSMGGGALLEFIETKGKLPGLLVLKK